MVSLLAPSIVSGSSQEKLITSWSEGVECSRSTCQDSKGPISIVDNVRSITDLELPSLRVGSSVLFRIRL